MKDKGTVYYVVSDRVSGDKEFETREEAAKFFERYLMDADERTMAEVRILRKKVCVKTESEL